MKSKKMAACIIAGVLILMAGAAGGCLLLREERKNFPADGYVLEVTKDEDAPRIAELTFPAGTQYRGKFPSSFVFKDIQGSKNVVDAGSFIHYSDGSVSAFTDGMAVNMCETGQGFLEFYRIKEGMVMTKASEGWEIDHNQNIMVFPELLWQLSDRKVLVASDGLTLELAGREPEEISGYLEVTWIDRDIVQVANQDTVCQTVTSDSKIICRSGASLDIRRMAVLDADGEVSFLLEELMADIESGGIAIQSKSDQGWQPPVFHIQAEDGRDGEAGKNGESGESGGIGEAGEPGESGGAGEDGEQGSRGSTGRQGSSGTQGASGAGGGSAGSGSSGVQGNAGNTIENKLGIIRIASLVYDCSSITSLDLAVVDGSDTFRADSGTVEIRDARTNKLVCAPVQADLRYEGNSYKHFEFKDILSADKEYTLIVKNMYSIPLTEGGVSSGEKVFIKRNFFTASEGVIMEAGKMEENGLKLNLRKQLSSTALYYALRIRIGSRVIRYPQYNFCDPLKASEGGIELKFDELSGDSGWISDIPYEIELYTSAAGNPALWEPEEQNGEPKGTGGEIKKSAQILTGRTLKRKPRIREVNAVLSHNGYYDLSVNVEEDKDNSIRNYRFVVSEVQPGGRERMIQELKTTSWQTKWYFGGSLKGQYNISCEVTYYDNEKDNIQKAQPVSVTAVATGSPSLTFEPYRSVNGEWTDHAGQVIAEADSGSIASVNASRIWGELKLSVNGKNLDTSTALAIKVTGNDTTAYERTITQTLPQAQRDFAAGAEIYWIPVKCLGLKADTVYTFDISGAVINTLNVGDAALTDRRVEWLGTASVKTDGLNGTEFSETESVAGFSITTRLNDSSNPDRIAALQLYADGSGGYPDKTAMNSTDPESNYYFERSVARAVQIGVFLETGARLGTIVKDLYKPDWSAVLMGVGAELELEETGGYSGAEKDYFFNGPLVTAPGEEYFLEKDDFSRAKINIDQQHGKIVLEAEALYDYSWKLSDDSKKYGEYFLDHAVPNYNSMKLNQVNIYSGGTIVKILNKETIDLGEKPPVLFDPSYSAVTVTEIRNSLFNEAGAAVQPDLKPDTTIGLKAASNYPNDNGDTTEITYYAMTVDSLKHYQEFNTGAGSIDIIRAFREGKLDQDNEKILFSITLDVKAYRSDKGTPPLYVIFTDEEAKLKKCGYDPDGKKWKNYRAVKENGRAVFYTNLMERGHCYVFAFTLKSMYHVNTMTGDSVEAWEFPYDIAAYVSTQAYNNEIQRSPGIEIYRETPRVAVYLDHTTVKNNARDPVENTAVWNYLAYDPDGAMESGFRPYAGAESEVWKYISQQYLAGSRKTSLLSCEISDEKVFTKNDYDSSDSGVGLKAVLSHSFHIDSFPARGKVFRFSVTVKSREDLTLSSFGINPYEIWLPAAEFADTSTELAGGSFEAYAKTRRETSGLLANKAEHFAISTVRHRFDSFTGDMSELRVTASVPDSGADSIFLNVAEMPSLTGRLTGFYYELRREGAGTGEDVSEKQIVQWGFLQYTKDMKIPLEKPKISEKVELYLRAVYDTGAAGLNKERIPSYIHVPKDYTPPGMESASVLAFAKGPGKIQKAFYAIQKQDENVYANGENKNTRRLSYSAANAHNSLYQITQSGPLSFSQEEYFEYQYRAHRWSAENIFADMDYRYGIRGGDVSPAENAAGELALLKGLAESEVRLDVSLGSAYIRQEEDGRIVIQTPPSVPNISQKEVWNNGFHSVDISITLTEKSVQTLLADNVYEPKIYFELYELGNNGNSAETVLLSNTGNRYFALVSEEDLSGGYANQAAGGKEAEGYRIDSAGDIKAYFMPEMLKDPEGNQSARESYKIAVRNLEMGKKYAFKMYCMKKTGRTKVYIIDNDVSSGRPSGEEYQSEFTMASYLNIGRSETTGTNVFTAKYEQKDYGVRNLKVIYSSDRTRDYYLQYQVWADGKPAAGLGPDQMMKYLGYVKKEMKSFFHFDGDVHEWKVVTYPVYYQENSTAAYINACGREERYQFAGNDALCAAGSYELRITAYDLYTGKEFDQADFYRQDNTILRNTTPAAPFTVPVREKISVEPRVTYEVDGLQSYAQITLAVRDGGFRLGVRKADGTPDMGYYRVTLQKLRPDVAEDGEAGWENVPLSGQGGADILGTVRDEDMAFMKGTTYVISCKVQNGERYRLKVTGMDILDEVSADREQVLYDSQNDSRMKINLSVTGLDKPRMDNPAFSFSQTEQKFTVSVQKGSNLDMISRVDITLYNMSQTPQISEYESIGGCRFQTPDSKNWREMTIPLEQILSAWERDGKISSKDSLVLTIQYKDADGILLAENAFSFMYK